MTRSLQKVADLKSFPQEKEIDFNQIENISIESKNNLKLKHEKDMEDIQREFKKTYVKLNDQLQRIQDYLK